MSIELNADPVVEPGNVGRRILAVAAGVVASLVTWALTSVVSGIPLTALVNGEQILAPLAIIVSSLIAGAVVWARLDRTTRRSAKTEG